MLLRTHDDHRWVVNKNAGEEDPVDAVEWVREAIGLPDLELDVISDWTWTAAAQLADRFSDGPVFLVGDAAHRVPPAGATGISSAMADAHNLAWKLAAVLQGWGGTSLLDSYAAERRQVGEATTRAALELWESRENPGQAAIDLRMIDMGYVYGEPGSLVDDLAGPYEQGTRPGGRAPHVWLQGDDHGRSTLDLFGPGFTVLATEEGQVWEAAASLAAKRTAVPLMACVRSEPAIRGTYGLSRGEAVLVRPDGHVACRLPSTPRPVDAGELLAAELERVTGGRL